MATDAHQDSNIHPSKADQKRVLRALRADGRHPDTLIAEIAAIKFREPRKASDLLRECERRRPGPPDASDLIWSKWSGPA